MSRKIFSRQFLFSDIAILCYLALFKLILHFLTNGNYGYFRDEFYYIACSDHLAFGYVDQPPLSIFLLAIVRGLLGDSIFVIRLLPALAGAFGVIITGLIAKELGGGRFAQVLAALAFIINGIYLGICSFFSMNSFELIFWTLSAYIVILIIKRENPKLWLLFGVVAGLGLMNKHSMLFFGFGITLGLLLTCHRRYFLNKWLWIAGLIAFVIFIPHIIWQIMHDYPSLEFYRIASLYKIYKASFSEFLSGQMLYLSFINVPIVFVGLYYYFFHKEGRRYRLLGWVFVIVLVTMIALKGKGYYITPIYSILFASGGVAIEKFIRKLNRNWLKPVFVSIMIINGIIVAPFAMAVLPVETFIKYADFMGITPPPEERHEMGVLPQHYADMFGWEEMVATVARVYQSLSPEEQFKCVILASNYGQAGAIDFFGKKYNLPKAISGHNNYYLWGPGAKTSEVVISLKIPLEGLKQLFEEVEQADIVKCKYCMPYENNYPVYLSRKPKVALQKVWINFKSFN